MFHTGLEDKYIDHNDPDYKPDYGNLINVHNHIEMMRTSA